MLVYIIIFVTALLYGLFELDGYKSKIKYNMSNDNIIEKISFQKKIIVILFFLQLVFISIFRNVSVGNDIANYIIHFNNIMPYYFSAVLFRNDPGYYLLNWIVGRFTTDFQYVMAIVSLIFFSLVFYFFYRESKIVWLSVVLFLAFGFLRFPFSGLRQGLAIAMIACSYKYIKNRNIWRFLGCVFGAALFHSTAIVCIPMYFISNNKLNMFTYVKYILLAFVVIIIVNRVFLTYLAMLYRDGRYLDFIGAGDGGFNMFLVLMGIVFVGLFFNKSTLLNDKKNLAVYNIIIFSIILQLMAMNLSILARLVDYYTFFLTIFIPNIIHSMKNKDTRILSILLMVVFSCLMYARWLIADMSGMVPYSFVWNH